VNLRKNVGVELRTGFHGECRDTLACVTELGLEPGSERIQFFVQSADQLAIGGLCLKGSAGLCFYLCFHFFMPFRAEKETFGTLVVRIFTRE